MHHKMNMAQLQAALAATPELVEKTGIQFHDGARLVSIPPAYSFALATAVANALREMIADQELADQR